MNLEHFTYLVEVIKCHSFNRAAKNLNVHPSTIAAGINVLEAEIGEDLFYRISSGVFPTDAGRKIYEDAVKILQTQKQWEHPETLVMPQFTDIRLGVVSAAYNSVIPEIVFRVADTGKHINLIIKEKQLKELDEGLFQKEYRIAIRSAQPEDRNRVELIAKNLNLNIVQLGRWPCMAFFHPEHILANHKMVSLQDVQQKQACSTENSFFEHYLSQIYPENVLLFPDQNALLNFLSHEAEYFTILSVLLQYSIYVQSGMLQAREFSDTLLPIDFYLFYPKENLTEKEKIVVETILRYFTELHFMHSVKL